MTAPVATPSIDLETVVFDYPDGTRALNEVSLRIEPGESVAIVGQNGSGKSTLVRQLNGLLRPTSGRVLLGGLDIRPTHVARLAGLVGLAFQKMTAPRTILRWKIALGLTAGICCAQFLPRPSPRPIPTPIAPPSPSTCKAPFVVPPPYQEDVRPGLLTPQAPRAGLDSGDADAGPDPR